MPLRFEKLLAIADRVERRRPRADGADAQLAQAIADAADGGEPARCPRRIAAESGRLGVEARERVRDAVLLEVIADAHLAAEAVAAVGDGHAARRVGRRLDQDGNAQVGHAQRFGNAALLSEIGQRYDDAVDLVAIGAKQVGALPRFRAGLHRAVLALFGREANGFVAGVLDGRDHLLAPALGQVVREKTRGYRQSIQMSFDPQAVQSLATSVL